MREPAEVGLLNTVIVGGAQTLAVFLIEQADPYVVKAALKAQQSFSRQPPQGIAAPVGNIVAGQKTFVVLFDAVAVDRVVEKQAEIRPQLQLVPRGPGLGGKGLIGIGIVINETQILPFRLSAFARIVGTETADLADSEPALTESLRMRPMQF